MIPTPEEEAFVEQMLDEALHGYEKITTPDELKVIRSCLRDELLFHPSGRRRLRQAMEAAPVAVSGTQPKKAPVTPAKKRGHGS